MSILHELWICSFCNYDPDKIYRYIDFFGSAENAYSAKASEYKKNPAYPVLSKLIKSSHDLSAQEKLLEDCKRKEIEIISIFDEDYPNYLKNSYLPPRVLFLKGERINLNNYVTVTVVGSRAATRNGKLMAHNLSQDLSAEGVIIVSGMAKGIDCAAHKGALSSGGKTIAVLAGGVDIIYPAENRDLYYQIMENGAIISEQPPGTAGRDYFYQRRNRIMAGIAYGCVMVEGCIDSGSSITMKHATSESRDLFAVPSNPMVDQSVLPNQLIKDGATMVIDYKDILNVYSDLYPNLLENGKQLLDSATTNASDDFLDYPLDENDIKIIEFLKTCGEAQFPDNICEACSIPINIILSRLTILNMGGILSREPGNKYSLIRR